MNSSDIVANVACRILRGKLAKSADCIKLCFQGLPTDTMVSCVGRLLLDPVLAPVTEVHLSRRVFAEYSLPDDCLTEQAVGDYRNEEPMLGKRLMLLGPPDNSEWDTVRLMQGFGEQELMDADDAWVDEFAPDIMDDQRKAWWRAALRGLNALAFARLDEFARFVYRTAREFDATGQLQEALGKSLPALRLPRRTDLFTIPEKQRGQVSQWKKRLSDHKRSTQCYLTKRDKADALINNEVLALAVKDYLESADAEPETARVFEDYIRADYGWSSASAALSELEWSVVNSALFERVRATKKQNLGEETLQLFNMDATLPDLTEEETEYLGNLAAKGEPADEDRVFFRRYYRELQTSPPLFSRWEGFILEKSVEDTDFLNGLARCLRILRPRADGRAWNATVKAKASKEKDLLQINEAAASYFATRYRGIDALLHPHVAFHGMLIFDYPSLLVKWRSDDAAKRKLKSDSTSRDACQLVFYVELDGDPHRQIKLVWRFNIKAVAANLRSDIQRLAEAKHSAVHTIVVRETTGRRPLPLNLGDAGCLQPVFGRASGSLIPQSEKLKGHSVYRRVVDALSHLVASRHLSECESRNILEAFCDFEEQYSRALTSFLDRGLVAAEDVQAASSAFGSLLTQSSEPRHSDTVLGAILPLVLSISIVTIEGFLAQPRPMAIVPPWHPLRLLAITSKAQQFRELVQELTSGTGTLSDADGALLFEDVQEWLRHPYYPEVVCHRVGNEPTLLSECATYYDYSLQEPPVLSDAKGLATDADPREAASQVGAILSSYLDLQPHEQDNLSVVLFDCSSDLLPRAVVEQIRGLSEDDEQDAMCQVVLAHSNPGKLRGLYRSLTSVPDTADTFNTSEATREFMARLRINIMVGEGTSNKSYPCHPYDVVFAEDTIARHARLKWYPVHMDIHRPEAAKPSAWSRRRPMAPGATTAAVFLSSPAVPECVWRYLKALSFAVCPEEARRTEGEQCLVAARSLDVHSHAIGKMLDSMHVLGSWVVNYDELLHRKLLQNKGIRIIRYKQNSTQGRNLVVSSTAKDTLLRSALRQLCAAVLPTFAAAELDALVGSLIADANAISGNLVLRAVRRAENAKELLGLVLSKYILQSEMGAGKQAGWFLLDDYSSWLGEEESQMADLLCLHPFFDGDEPVLEILVTEAKFTDHTSQAKRARESANQLRQTLSRLERGIVGGETSLDRRIWLARISDLIVDGIEAAPTEEFDALSWRRMVRSGSCKICLRGYSHIFDHGFEQLTPTEPKAVRDTLNGTQELFSIVQIRSFLEAFASQTPVIRHQSAPRGSGGRLEQPRGRSAESPVGSIMPGEGEGAPVTSGGAVAVSEPNIDVQAPHQSLDFSRLIVDQTGGEDTESMAQWAGEASTALRRALIGYDMPAELAQEPFLTPNSLLFKFRGTDRLTAAAIERRRAELYTTHGIKVINVRPEAGAVAISVERPQRQIVRLSAAWSRWDPRRSDTGNTSILVGIREEDNSLLFLDPLAQSPHTLIAGTSGSGKSVLLQNILLGIAATNAPETAKILLIDPKHGVDYGPLAMLPHIESGITTDPDEAVSSIEALVAEMESRYPKLQAARVNHIRSYNQKASERLPYVWLIHDEFADWMQDEGYRSRVVSLVNRLGMKARAAGIFLIFAAQRPSVDVMPMQLRDNLDNRLILRVAQEGTSMFCLGEKGAENLLPHGQMLARLGGAQAALGQVPYADFEDLQRLSEVLARFGEPSEQVGA